MISFLILHVTPSYNRKPIFHVRNRGTKLLFYVFTIEPRLQFYLV